MLARPTNKSVMRLQDGGTAHAALLVCCSRTKLCSMKARAEMLYGTALGGMYLLEVLRFQKKTSEKG